ncbi:MAG: urea transporter [Nitrospinota bacterium]
MRALRRALEVGRAWASGYGQVLFCESPLGGLLLFLGFTLIVPAVGLAGAVSGGVATLVARALGYPSGAWRAGLYGYAGVLCGLFWGVLFSPGVGTGIALAAAAAASAPLTYLLHRILTPREIPTLALPALCLIWLAWPFLGPAESTHPVGDATQLVGLGLILAGLAVHSRLLTLAALVGAGVGLGLSALLSGGIEAGLLFNSVPTAMALAAVFLPWSGPAAGVAASGAAAAGVLWWGASAVLGPSEAPLLVAPFNLVTVGLLGALHLSAFRRLIPGRPSPLPFNRVGRPEEVRAEWLARRRLHDRVRKARRICVLTGAGVSTAAGLPDFRGQPGFWADTGQINFEKFLTSPEVREAYWREEEKFFRLLRGACPTITHRALAALYRQGRLSAVVTQNVDGLHQAAGLATEAVIELHGTIHEAQCVDCGQKVSREALSTRMTNGAAALHCDRCQGLLKGGGLMFGEEVEPKRLEAAVQALLSSDLLLVLGTSLEVAPASDLLLWARDAGIPIAIVNATPTAHDRYADVTVNEDVGAVLHELLQLTEAGTLRTRADSQTPPSTTHLSGANPSTD